MRDRYTKRLMLVVLCTMLPTLAFASGAPGGLYELVLFIVLAVPLLLCLGSWIVGKGNRLLYILTAPLIAVLLISWVTKHSPVEPQLFAISVSLIIYALIIKKYKHKKNVPNGIIHFSCKECGFEAGLSNLKNGLCKSCSEKQLNKQNITKNSS